MIQLFVCDWEGCVSEPGGGIVPWKTNAISVLADLVNRMRQDNAAPAVVLCSGRQFPYGEAAIQAINAYWENRPSVLENGVGLYFPNTKKVLWNPAITSETTRAMTQVRAEVGRIADELGAERELGKEYCISLNPPAGMTTEAMSVEIAERLDRFVAEGIIEPPTHSKSAVDITPRGVNKGSGVQFLAEVTQVPLADMVGIGDTAGDMPMLRLVGHPAAPANADQFVKDAAEYISSRQTTGGVIDIIQHYLSIDN